MRLVPGEEFGRYRVEAEIGRGGQAVVYRATQLDLDRPVALKVFDEGYLARGGALERFRREAIAAGRLDHPRIVPVYDAGEVAGRAYLTMRLVPGDTLAERIARVGPPDPEVSLAILGDVAAAIDFAHDHGAVHRDVKPANILIDRDGTAFLTDFGLVRIDDLPGVTRRGDWLGTPEYVSPEQVEGEPATRESDLYSLAVVAFEALTGRAPFVRREPSAVLLAHVRDAVPDASALAPGLPAAVDAVLARGMAKDPAERPAGAAALVGELRAALASRVPRRALVGVGAAGAGDDEATDMPAVPPDRPTIAFGDAPLRRREERTRRLLAVAGAGAILLAVALGAGGWVLGSSSADAGGAESRGYAAGETAGREAGFTAGRTAGVAAGTRTGLARGRAQGRAAGKKEGLAQGRKEGYAEGATAGRQAALGGLSSGAWYIVRVGSDDAGPVVGGATRVAADAGQCYAVTRGRVFSTPC